MQRCEQTDILKLWMERVFLHKYERHIQRCEIVDDFFPPVRHSAILSLAMLDDNLFLREALDILKSTLSNAEIILYFSLKKQVVCDSETCELEDASWIDDFFSDQGSLAIVGDEMEHSKLG